MRCLTAFLCLLTVVSLMPASADEVADGVMPRWLAINPTTQKLYVSNTGSNNVSVIDLNTSKVIAAIPVQLQPDHVVVDPVADRIYVSNMGSASVSVINGTNNEVEDTVLVRRVPMGMALDPDNKRLYVACQADNALVAIDIEQNTVAWQFATGKQPTDVAYDPTRQFLYLTLYGEMHLAGVPLRPGVKPIEIKPLPFIQATSIMRDPVFDRLWIVDCTGVREISLANFDKHGTAGEQGETGIAMDPGLGTFYMTRCPRPNHVVPTAFNVYRFTLDPVAVGQLTGETLARLKGPVAPVGIAVHPTTHLVYVADSASNGVAVYDPNQKQFIGFIPLTARGAGQQ